MPLEATKTGIECGKVLGGIGGASAAVWAATQVWPIITSAVPGGGGVICAILASAAMCSAGCGVGAFATACGCCIVGSCTEGAFTLFSSRGGEESRRLTASNTEDYTKMFGEISNIVATQRNNTAV